MANMAVVGTAHWASIELLQNLKVHHEGSVHLIYSPYFNPNRTSTQNLSTEESDKIYPYFSSGLSYPVFYFRALAAAEYDKFAAQ